MPAGSNEWVIESMSTGAVLVEDWTEDRVRELHRLYQGEWWTRGRTLEEVRTVLEHSDVLVGLVSPGDGALLAFARVLTDRVFKAFIFDVIVAADERGRGLGRELMERICRDPRLSVVKHFELYCRPELMPFYRRWGFEERLQDVVLLRRTTR